MNARILWGSFRNNRGRLAIALLAFFLMGVVAGAVGNFALDTDAKMRRELRGYGANLVVLPRQGTLSLEQCRAAADIAGPCLEALSQKLFGIAAVEGRTVTLCGCDAEDVQKLSPGWHADGRWMTREEPSCMIGSRLARRMGIKAGSTLKLKTPGGREMDASVTGMIQTGGSEDQFVFVPLHAAQEILDLTGRTSVLELRVNGMLEQVEEIASSISRNADADATPVYRIARTEAAVLAKLQWILAAIVATLLLNAAICLTSTLAASVVEREKEISLMLALGSNPRSILALLAVEALTVAWVGSLAGYLAGLPLAGALSRALFDAELQARPEAALVLVVMATLVSLLAVGTAGARALRLEPARILKGE